MPLFLKKNISPSATIGLWKSEEPLEELFEKVSLREKEKLKISSLKNESRKTEILCTKLLLKELYGKTAEIFYDEKGKPHLKNSHTHISLSHSHQFIAVIIDKNHETGIDIQKITPKITRIKKKFLSMEELKNIPEDEKMIEKLHVLWGAKECVFKAHGKGNLIFSENIFVEPFELKTKGEITANLKLKNKCQSFCLQYENLPDALDYMLLYVKETLNIV